MGRRTITGITIADKNKRAKFIREGVVVDGKRHRLLSIPLGTRVVLKTTSRFIRTRSANEHYEEFKDKIKWIYGLRDNTSGDWDYISWEDKKPFPIEINDEQVYDYADEPLVALKSLDPDRVGELYWLEAFINGPEFPNAAVPKGVFIVFEDAPFVKKACFSRRSFCDFTKAEQTNIPVTQYGQTINLFLRTYKLADPSLGYHNYGVFKVIIFSVRTKKAVSEPIIYEQKSKANPDTFLDTIRLSMLVELDWRTKSGHKPDTEEAYYAEVVPILAFNTKAVEISDTPADSDSEGTIKTLDTEALKRAMESAQKGETKTRITATNDDIVLLTYTQRKFRDTIIPALAKQDLAIASLYTREELEKFKVKHNFKVLYGTEKEIIGDRNEKVGEQMASIMDTKYDIVPNDYGCKFTEISINDPDRTGDVIIFQEIGDGTVTDATDLPFEIIAGDKEKKKITISLCDLEHAGTPIECLKIGRHHENAEAVWGVDEALAKLQWLEDDDIDIDENVMKLALQYHYSKSYDNRILDFLALNTDYLSGGLAKLKHLWVIKYLYWLVIGEKFHQSYFIPISTCRYPDQKLLIDVYPDMKWVINFAYNITEPLYFRDTPTQMAYNDTDVSEDISGRIKSQREDADAKKIAAAYQNQKSDFGIYVSCEINDKKLEDLGGKFFKKFRDMIGPLQKIVDLLDGKLGISDAKMETESLKVSGKTGLAARLNRLPLSFELIAPQLGVGFGIGYGEAVSGPKIGYELEGRIIANPIIGANVILDVLALGSKIKPWGAIIDALDIADFLLNFCSGGKVDLEYKIEVKFSAEIVLVGSKSEDGTNTPATVAYNFGTKEWKAPDIALQGRIKGEITFEFGIKLKAKINDAKGEVTKESDEKMKEVAGAGITAGAHTEVSLTFGKDFGKNGKFATDFYFSGVTVFIKFEGGYKGKSKKPSSFPVIPDIKKTFDIINKTGEIK